MMYSAVNSSQGCQSQGKSDFIQDFVSGQEISKSLLNVSGKSGSFISRLLQNNLVDIAV